MTARFPSWLRGDCRDQRPRSGVPILRRRTGDIDKGVFNFFCEGDSFQFLGDGTLRETPRVPVSGIVRGTA